MSQLQLLFYGSGIIILIIFVVFIVVTLYRTFKYGYQFSSAIVQHKSYEDSLPTLLTSLKALDIDMRIVIPKEYNSDVILVSDGGIFLIKMFKYQSGRVCDKGKYFEIKDNDNIYKTINPFKQVEADYHKIHDMFKDVPIYAYVIFGDLNLLDFTYAGIAKTVRYKNLNYQIRREYNETNRFISAKELKNINNKLR